MGLIRVLLTMSSVVVLWTSPAFAALNLGTFVPAYTDATTPYNVVENTASGHSIVQIVVDDADGGTVSYALASADDDQGVDKLASFAVDGDVLKTAAVLDFEGGSAHFDIVVTASTTTDGIADRIVRIRVGIVDLGVVCSPDTYDKKMNNGDTVGTAVVTLTCSDPNAAVGASYTYAIISGDVNGDFAIDNNGAMTVNKVLNKTATPTYNVLASVRGPDSETDSDTVTVNISFNGVAEAAKHLYILPVLLLFTKNFLN